MPTPNIKAQSATDVVKQWKDALLSDNDGNGKALAWILSLSTLLLTAISAIAFHAHSSLSTAIAENGKAIRATSEKVIAIKTELDITKPADVLQAFQKLDGKVTQMLSLDILPGAKERLDRDEELLRLAEKRIAQLEFRLQQIERQTEAKKQEK